MSKKSNRQEDRPEEGSARSLLRHIRPRLVPLRLQPFKQQIKNVRDQASLLSNLTRQIRGEIDRPCPRCNETLIYQPKANDQMASFTCPSCSFVETLAMDPIEASTRADRFSKLSNQIFYVGLALGCAGAIWAAIDRSLFTFIGSVLITAILLIQSAGYKYRTWQYSNLRLYEERAPIREWLMHELPAIGYLFK